MLLGFGMSVVYLIRRPENINNSNIFSIIIHNIPQLYKYTVLSFGLMASSSCILAVFAQICGGSFTHYSFRSYELIASLLFVAFGQRIIEYLRNSLCPELFMCLTILAVPWLLEVRIVYTHEFYYGINALYAFYLLFPLCLALLFPITQPIKAILNSKIALILGNGFDLDLGLRTSYNDYRDSAFWPFNDEGSYHHLGAYLNQRAKESSWFSIEDELAKYGMMDHGNDGPQDIAKDKEDYHALIKGLQKHILSCQEKEIRTKSFAFQLLRELNDLVGYKTRVFTFNYTNYRKIMEGQYEYSLEEEHIHGCADGDWSEMIFGVGDYCEEVKNGYDFLYKSSNPLNLSTTIDQLSDYDIIIFMGHSLSKVDFVYFSDLFAKLSEAKYRTSHNRKLVRIYTRNESDADHIMHNIRGMNKQVTQIVYNSSCRVETTEHYYDCLKDNLQKQHPDFVIAPNEKPYQRKWLDVMPSDVIPPSIDIIREIKRRQKGILNLFTRK